MPRYQLPTANALCDFIESTSTTEKHLLQHVSTPSTPFALGTPTFRQSSTAAQTVSFPELDKLWQRRWSENRVIRASELQTKPKSYILPMFAYPSGALHMGHLRVYTISDVLARYKRMKGYEVLHPTGWDAFGLPAENAAIERGLDPAEWTNVNIQKMKQQLIGMNTDFDWDCEIKTCAPEFYKHTQKIFLMLLRRGLAYQAEARVNYDPVDKTVLANEQVDSLGRSWRSGAIVEQVNLKQWFFRISAFRKELLDDLSHLENDGRWPARVISQQRNWLGRSTGAKISFGIELNHFPVQDVHVFTTRPDTLYGVTYLALSLSHPLVLQLAQHDVQLQAFIAQKSSLSTDSKLGFRLSSVSAVSPLTSGTPSQSPLPVFAAPYVLDDYGEAAVMGVPGHDARDLAFWKQNMPNACVPIVVSDGTPPTSLSPLASNLSRAFPEKGTLTSLNGLYTGLSSDVAAAKIVNDLTAKGSATVAESWRLRDWLVSRQRYWGTPIPVIHCKACGAVPVPEEELPIELPKLDNSVRKQLGNPLDKIDHWVNTDCPSCGGSAKRDTDTMDTFVDSSWYFLRFADVHNTTMPFSKASAKALLSVDTYIGGVEHAILHLLYARFMYKFLVNEGLVENCSSQEPFSQLISQGMVHGQTFSDPHTGRFLRAEELRSTDSGPIIVATGERPVITWEKMSKSKYNGVDPGLCIAKYGADATRAHILFSAPVDEILQWDEGKIVGIQRWFSRITRLIDQVRVMNFDASFKSTDFTSTQNAQNLVNSLTSANAEAFLLTQNTMKGVSHTFERDLYGLNTVISNLTKLTNGLASIGVARLESWVAYDGLSALLRMLAPIAPAFAEQCWEDLHSAVDNFSKKAGVFECGWPEVVLGAELEALFLARMQTTTCAVQVNGKLRFTVQVPVMKSAQADGTDMGSTESLLVDTILATREGKYWLQEKNDWASRKRVVVVAGGKLVNIVF